MSDRTIGNVIQRGRFIYAYDQQGRLLFTRAAGSGPGDGLLGYTSKTVNVGIGAFVYSYDEAGHRVASIRK